MSKEWPLKGKTVHVVELVVDILLSVATSGVRVSLVGGEP